MFPFSLITGGPMTKVLIGIVAAMALACGLLFWMYTGKAEAAAKWELEHQNVTRENLLWAERFQEEVEQRKLEASISISRELKRAELATQNIALQQHIQELSYEQPEVSQFLDRSIPADLLSSLQQYATTNESAGTGEDVPAKALDDAVSTALDPREPD